MPFGSAWIRFLSEELKVFHCPLSPSTLLLALTCPFLLDLHPQHLFHLLHCLLLCYPRLYVKIISTRRYTSSFLFVFSLRDCLFLCCLPPHPHSCQYPLSHGVGGPLYAGLEACAQLEITTRRLHLIEMKS